MLGDLNFPVDKDNFVGVDRFWFVPIGDIDYVDDQLQVVLKEGKVWYLGRVTRYTLNFTNPSRDSKGGTIFRPRLTGIASKHTPDMESLFSKIRGKRFVIIYKDKNGYLNQVGTKGQPLVFETDQSTGNTPDTKNGVTITFSGETRQPPVHYIRELVVNDQPADVLPVSQYSTVYINNNLITSLAPGERFDIFSQFSLQFDLT